MKVNILGFSVSILRSSDALRGKIRLLGKTVGEYVAKTRPAVALFSSVSDEIRANYKSAGIIIPKNESPSTRLVSDALFLARAQESVRYSSSFFDGKGLMAVCVKDDCSGLRIFCCHTVPSITHTFPKTSGILACVGEDEPIVVGCVPEDKRIRRNLKKFLKKG